MITIRNERPADERAREALLDAAYGHVRYTKPSARLRRNRPAAKGLSLVAIEHGTMVGTVRLWTIEAGVGCPALLLGPLAVDPAHRKRGIGSSLVRRALAKAAQRGHRAVLLVGDPAFYGKFGFSAEKTSKLKLFGLTEAARLLGLELIPGALASAHGRIVSGASGDDRLAIFERLVRPTGTLIPRAA